jgi:hypothetical protein
LTSGPHLQRQPLQLKHSSSIRIFPTCQYINLVNPYQPCETFFQVYISPICARQAGLIFHMDITCRRRESRQEVGCHNRKFSGQPFSCDRLRLEILNFERQIKLHLHGSNPNKKGGTQIGRPLETSFIVWLYGFLCNRSQKRYYSIFFAVK